MNDLRYAFRGLLRTPGFTAAAVLTLALGIGAHAAVFGIVDALIFRPLPYDDAERLVHLARISNPARRSYSPSVPLDMAEMWAGRRDLFEGVAFYRLSGQMALWNSGGDPIWTTPVAPGLMKFLGARPAIGREFAEHETESDLIILGHALWVSLFAADPQVLGKTVTLDNRAFIVIGVMSPDFYFPSAMTSPAQAWIPLQARTEYVSIAARLRPGIAPEHAQRHVDSASARLQQELPRADKWLMAVRDYPGARMPAKVRLAFIVLLGAVGLVVLIACANVASLFLGRTFSRLKELGIRAAMGASRAQLVRQTLFETLVVAVAGGALGVLFSTWILDASRLMLPSNIGAGTQMNYRVTLLAGLLVLISALLCGLGPAIRAARRDLSTLLIPSTRTTGFRREQQRAYRALVAIELAITFVLLFGTGLLANSFVRLVTVDVGFNTSNLEVVSVRPPIDRYSTPDRQRAFYEEALRRVRLIPGVVEATAGRNVPPDRGIGYELTSGPGAGTVRADSTPVEPNFFRTLEIPLLAGRSFTAADVSNTESVMIVNDALARDLWPHRNPLDQRLQYRAQTFAVVGVVSDVKTYGFESGRDSYKAYVPVSQYRQLGEWVLAARTSRDADEVLPGIREILRSLDSSVLLSQVSTAEKDYDRLFTAPRLSVQAMGVFGAGALALALIGIYGLVAFAVSQRQQEIGIRIALGADARRVRRMVVREAAAPAAIGLGLGLCAGVPGSLVLRNYLYEVSPFDPFTIIVVMVLLIMTVAAVAWLPARRATRVDPIATLRCE